MGETISLIANVCGILGFILSIFAVTKVIKINNRIKDSNKVSVKDTSIGGDFVGRDKK